MKAYEAASPSELLSQLIASNDWMDIPPKISSREGYEVNTSGEQWRLYTPARNRGVDFSLVKNGSLQWATKHFLIHCIRTISAHEGLASWDAIRFEMLAHQTEFGIDQSIPPEGLKEHLVYLMQAIIQSAREKKRLWALYRVARWYIWCADHYPELGFCAQYANELDGMRFPGNPHGEAVRSNDPESGPLDVMYELPILRKALEGDSSTEWAHLKQKAAVALCIAFGRNPTNLVWLNESDLSVELEDVEGVDPFYTLKIPRIKKRQIRPRDDFRVEPMDAPLVKHVQRLIEANSSIDAYVMTDKGEVNVNRPLFIRPRRPRIVPFQHADTALRANAAYITQLVKDFARRHELSSPLTGKPMMVTVRRLRYSLATALVDEGISRRELAEILDHTDTQHVEVYFEQKGKIVKHLDAAAQPKLAKMLGFFKGKVVANDKEAINGDREDKHLSFVDEGDPEDQTDIGVCGESAICNLDPPFSCYLCPKFQPYMDADHQHVYDCLCASREDRLEKYENSRLGIQLDDVITAVSVAIEECKKKKAELANG